MKLTAFSPSALWWWPLALLSATGALLGAADYPVLRLPLVVLLLLYAVWLWRAPAAWLFVLPALAPLLDLTPWSGRFFFEEIDLFVLVTLAMGYARLPANRPVWTLSPLAMWLLFGLAFSYVISLGLGLFPLSPLDANAFSNHLSHYNGLRIFKGFAWAVLLLPLLGRATAHDPAAFRKWLIPGMLVGLGGVTLVSWWERWTFAHLMDFASDYRITALFSSMNLGGAALDGYFALSLPFLLAWAMTRTGAIRSTLGALLFFAASYAVMATFSRGLYLAYGLVILFGMVAIYRASPPGQGRRMKGWLGMAALLAAGIMSWRAFGSGGYRVLAALMTLFAAIWILVPLVHRRQIWPGTLLMLPLALAVSWGIGLVAGKAPYIAFALSALVFLLAMDLVRAKARTIARLGGAIAAMSVIWLGMNTLWMAKHWGGQAALLDAAIAVGASGAVLVLALQARETWVSDKRNFLLMGIGLVALAMAIPALHSYRMQDRFGEARQDFSGRMSHWQAVIGIMAPDQWTFGAGLGRFAETYYWKNPLSEFPGTYRLADSHGAQYLQLSGARYAQGYGESLRVGQRIGLSERGVFTLRLDARTNMPKAKLEVNVCEKWLLYRGQCAGRDLMLKADGASWQTVQFDMDTRLFKPAPWHARPTVQFSMSNETAGAVIEVRNVSLTGPDGGERIRNGDFAGGFDRWFFTSDHHHLPWHAKNIGLNVYFDQGVFGLLFFLLLNAYALLRLARKGSMTGIPAPALAASLAGFLVVGLFDSLLDVPRLAWLYYLLLLTALLKPRGAA